MEHKMPREIGDVYDSDVSYVTLMNNKELVHDITNLIINEAVKEQNQPAGKYVFGGNFIIGQSLSTMLPQDLSALVDEFTVDLIDGGIPAKKGTYKTQGIYSTLSIWFRDHAPAKDKCTIYFIGQPHTDPDVRESLDVHWNCFIVDQIENKIYWYDPSESVNRGVGYNFDEPLKKYTVNVLKMINPRFKTYTVLTLERAQQICNPKNPAADIFCQSWVIFFASAWVNNCFENLIFFPFQKIQNFPLKLWLKCIISRNRPWKATFARPEFKLFQTSCRIYNNDCIKLINIPPLIKQKCKEKPCIYSVLTFILNLPDCYNGISPAIANESSAIRDKWLVPYAQEKENPTHEERAQQAIERAHRIIQQRRDQAVERGESLRDQPVDRDRIVQELRDDALQRVVAQQESRRRTQENQPEQERSSTRRRVEQPRRSHRFL